MRLPASLHEAEHGEERIGLFTVERPVLVVLENQRLEMMIGAAGQRAGIYAFGSRAWLLRCRIVATAGIT